jgi:hypothetical protein
MHAQCSSTRAIVAECVANRHPHLYTMMRVQAVSTFADDQCKSGALLLTSCDGHCKMVVYPVHPRRGLSTRKGGERPRSDHPIVTNLFG